MQKHHTQTFFFCMQDPQICMYAACIICTYMKGSGMKDMRTRLGMTQAQLAEALGISTRTVATYEAGTEPPKAIRLACRWIEHEATANALDDDSGLSVEMSLYEPAPTMADLADLRRRIVSLERPVRILQQRMTELSAAIEDAGLPLRQAPIPMTEEEAEEAELKILKAQLLEQMNRAAKPAPGALTDDERADAERARRQIAKARSLAQGEPWE